MTAAHTAGSAAVCKTTDHFTFVFSVTWPLNCSEAGGDLVLMYTSLLLLCKFVGLMLTSLHLNEKSKETCIKARSLVFIGQVTEHTTAKWPVCEKTVKAVE